MHTTPGARAYPPGMTPFKNRRHAGVAAPSCNSRRAAANTSPSPPRARRNQRRAAKALSTHGDPGRGAAARPRASAAPLSQLSARGGPDPARSRPPALARALGPADALSACNPVRAHREGNASEARRPAPSSMSAHHVAILHEFLEESLHLVPEERRILAGEVLELREHPAGRRNARRLESELVG
jgi:hypothetical protein